MEVCTGMYEEIAKKYLREGKGNLPNTVKNYRSAKQFWAAVRKLEREGFVG